MRCKSSYIAQNIYVLCTKKRYNNLLKLVPINVNMFRYSRAHLRVYVLENRIVRPNEHVNCTSKDIYTIAVNDCIVYTYIQTNI